MSKERGMLNGGETAVWRILGFRGTGVLPGALLCVLTGLFAARAEVLGNCAPFGVAAVAVASGSDGVFVLLGAVAGYFLPYGPVYPAKYVAAALLCLTIEWMISGFPEIARHPATRPLLAGATMLVTGMSVVISTGLLPYDVVLCLAETLLCGCSVVFLQEGFPLLRKPAKIWGLDQQKLSSVTIAACILLLSLSKVGVGGLSLGRVLGVAAVLIAARYGGAAGGAVAGGAIGMMLCLGDKQMALILSCYAFGGMLAGIFGQLGRFSCTAAFVLANAMAAVYIDSSHALTELYEVMLASVGFMLLPERTACRLSVLFVPARNTAGSDLLRQEVKAKLDAAADAMDDISKTVIEVTDRLHKIPRSGGDDVSAVFHAASDRVCRKCGMCMYCWETAFNDTMNAMNDVTPLLRQKGSLEAGDLPGHFAARCCRVSEFAAAVSNCYAEYNTRRCEESKAFQLRRVLSEQLEGMGGLLRNFAREVSAFARLEPGLSQRARTVFASCGVHVSDSFCRIDQDGRLSVEAAVESGDPEERETRARMGARLSEACGAALSGPVLCERDGVIRVRFSQKPEFSVRFGQALSRKEGESLCGDSCVSFVDEQGRAVMILSDGMGCGGSAAVDSNLATRFMSELLRAGFDFDGALNLVNSALMVKSPEETFATLDLAVIDLFTGRSEFLKAGAPPTYLRRCGRVERLAQSSMPAGIVRGVRFERTAAQLRRGDLVALVSDGVVGSDDAWFVKMLEEYRGENLTGFTKEVLDAARAHWDESHGDDMTVLMGFVR